MLRPFFHIFICLPRQKKIDVLTQHLGFRGTSGDHRFESWTRQSRCSTMKSDHGALQGSTSKLGMDSGLKSEPENLSFSSKYGTRVFKIKTREPRFWNCTINFNFSICHQLDYGIKSFFKVISYLIQYLKFHPTAYKSLFYCFIALNRVLQEECSLYFELQPRNWLEKYSKMDNL